MQAMLWDDLRYVLAIGRAGSMAGAGRRLTVDQTTVTRRLRAIEGVLGCRLFERVDGALRPTPMGEATIARAAEIEAHVECLKEGVAGGDAAPVGVVRVTAVPIIANRILIPAMPAFVAEYPAIRLELNAEARNVSLVRHEADIALRLSRPEQAGASLTKRIGQLEYAVYGARGRSPDRLPWIGYHDGLSHLPQARWIAAASTEGPRATLSVGDAESLLAAIRAGLGKSLLPCKVAEQEKRLERVNPFEAVLSREIWLLTHRKLRRHGRIVAVIGWLEELFARP
jgi:DNA-binding transcriptional LysR family regulator